MSSNILRSLEETFGSIPSYIKEHLKYFTFNPTNEEFHCVPCVKTIKIVNTNKNSCDKNFRAHVFSKSHKEISSSLDEVFKALSKTFKGKIPQVVRNNIYVLDTYEEDYKCAICNKILKVKGDPSETERSFYYHLLSFDHKKKWEEHKEIGGELKDIFGEIPEDVISNKEFLRLTRSGKNYVCTVCNVLLVVDEHDLENTTDTFKDHFRSSEHIRNTKEAKVRSLCPNMQKQNSRVPSYLTRNIDYITTSETDLFCNLCHEIVKCDQTDISVTEQNLKIHLLSTDHEENVFISLDHDNELFDNLRNVIGEFSETVLANLRYLRLTEDYFNCSICDSEVAQLNTVENYEEIKDIIIYHFESDVHRNNLSEEMQGRTNLINSLEDLFGGIPSMIQDNISYLEFKGGNNFQCTLCDATLQSNMNSDDAEHVARITQENFERHLGMSKHMESVENEDYESDLMQEELENLFDPIPQFIIENLDHIQYDNDNENFFCVLCDQAILIDNGNKKEEITLQNFRTHLHSVVHLSNVKRRAKKESDVTEKLNSIFGKVPSYILSNVEYLYEDDDSFHCDACDVEIILGSCSETSKKNFYRHLTGLRHKSNLEDIEVSIDSAHQFLNNNFCLPEFLVKVVDIWENSGEDLYCTLCQDILIIDYDDLEQTRQSLKCHLDSERHTFNMKLC